MNIYIASDHAGFSLKELLTEHLTAEGHSVKDYGAYAHDEGDDYPDFITPCAEAVAGSDDTFGIVIGGSGQGEVMAANRITGVRAALYYGGSHDIVTLSRTHNNANILSLGARFVSFEEARAAVKLFLETPFSGDERHVRRIAKF